MPPPINVTRANESASDTISGNIDKHKIITMDGSKNISLAVASGFGTLPEALITLTGGLAASACPGLSDLICVITFTALSLMHRLYQQRSCTGRTACPPRAGCYSVVLIPSEARYA